MKRQYWILLVYSLLVVIGIPWYWPKTSDVILFGFPAWVFVAIVVSVCASVFTAFLLLRYPWKIEEETEEESNE
ncbi:MAG: hypothetical protein ACPHLK_05560 [Gammaproteobacteria bacterium]|jgi:MFS superfamily sulfate permease-like transporter